MPTGMGLCLLLDPIMRATGQEPQIIGLANEYNIVIVFSMLPMVINNVLRSFVSALDRPIIATPPSIPSSRPEITISTAAISGAEVPGRDSATAAPATTTAVRVTVWAETDARTSGALSEYTTRSQPETNADEEGSMPLCSVDHVDRYSSRVAGCTDVPCCFDVLR